MICHILLFNKTTACEMRISDWSSDVCSSDLNRAKDFSALMRDEIFGPILPVIGYGHLDEAIAWVNDHDRPLALYVFDNDRARVQQQIGRASCSERVSKSVSH